MGTFLTSYGGAAYDHEGYAAQVLADGSLTSTYSDDTERRMIGQVVAACDCGWTGTTRYPTTTGPFDGKAQELALAEWEHTHARPVLEGHQRERWTQLLYLLRDLATEHRTQAGRTEAHQRDRVELLDRTLRTLAEATELTRQLREQAGPAETPSGGSR